MTTMLGRSRSFWLCGAILASGLATATPPASAEKTDRQAPTVVESDRMEYDEKTQINVFTGNVVLNRGTLQIRGDRLVLRQDPEGFQYGTATGRLASFRQKRDGLDEWIHGKAEELQYDTRKETLRLLRQAQVRRTQSTRTLDDIEGALIIYDTVAEQFTVEGASGTAPGGRVRATIQPREADAPATPSTVRRDGPEPSAPLRSAPPAGPAAGPR
jgi:lipopolysaccharide export system protein LptA